MLRRLTTIAFSLGLAVLSVDTRAEVTVRDAWVRATVPAQKSTGAFLVLRSTQEARLVGASTPLARSAELHASSSQGGVMHMHAVDGIALPAGGTVALESGGFHLMLFGLKRPLAAGERLPLSLIIEGRDGKRTTVDVSAEVRPLAP